MIIFWPFDSDWSGEDPDWSDAVLGPVLLRRSKVVHQRREYWKIAETSSGERIECGTLSIDRFWRTVAGVCFT